MKTIKAKFTFFQSDRKNRASASKPENTYSIHGDDRPLPVFALQRLWIQLKDKIRQFVIISFHCHFRFSKTRTYETI